MHERDIMKLKAIRSKNPPDWSEFKRLRNKVNNNIKIAKGILSQFTNNHLLNTKMTLEEPGKL